MKNKASFKYIKKLSQIKSNSGIHFLSPAAFPGNHCPLHTAVRTGTDIEGMSSLVIGSQECGFYSRLVVEKTKGDGPELHWMYILDAKEVVFGCREGLIEAIKEMDAQGAKGILLISTCVPELIGEDIESVAFELQEEVQAKLFPVKLPHFRCNSYPSGFWKSFEALISGMSFPTEKNGGVNLLGGVMSPGLKAMMEILKEKNKPVYHVGIKKKLEDILNLPKAALNLVLSSWDQPWAAAMEKKFGIPYIPLHSAYSLQQIDQAFERLEKLTEAACKQQEGEREKLAVLEHRFRQAFQGKSFIVTEGRADTIQLALYLASLGMKPLALHLEEFFPEDKQWSQALLELGMDPFVFHGVNFEEEGVLLQSLKPDLRLGELTMRGLNSLNGNFGYQRSIELLTEIFEAMSAHEEALEGGIQDGIA